MLKQRTMIGVAILLLVATHLNAAKPDEQTARPTTDYVKQSVIYQIQMRSFTREGDHQGRNGALAEACGAWR